MRNQFTDAAEALNATSSSTNPLTAMRAQGLRTEILGVLSQLDQQSATLIEKSAVLTTRQLAAIHEAATVATYDATGLIPNTATIAARFDRVPIRAMAAVNARGGTAQTFRSLTRRHLQDAAPAVDRLIGSSIAQGISADKLTKDLAGLLMGESVNAGTYGLLDVETGGLRSLYSDSRRIAVTEINNALREGNRISLIEGGIVAAAMWQVSGRHDGLPSSPDECDDLAAADDFDFGPGMYPPEEWPEAPHPYCGCTQGGPIVFLSPDQWPDAEGGAEPESPSDEGGEAIAAATTETEETITKFRRDDGSWEPERREIHDEIKEEFLGGLTPVENPTVRMLGGGPASGKSVMLKEVPENWAHIDPDAVKGMLPEWGPGVAAGDPGIAGVLHEESSYLAKQIANEAINSNFNVIVDGTGDNSYDNLAAKVASYRRSGNQVVAEYVTVDTDVAIQRANARGAKSGRFVPETVISEIHRNVSIVVPRAIENGLFDEFVLWDNNGSTAFKVAEAVGRELTIYDEAAWQRFLAKAN